MDGLRDKLGENKYIFFKKLENYLNVELIFFGSIKRIDFFQDSSDIDITIITDNVPSLLSKLTNYLQINSSEIKKIVHKFTEDSSTIVPGYKIKYNNNDIFFDMLIYDDKYKNAILENINAQNFPFYLISILYILKFLHYRLYLLSHSLYMYLKNAIFYMYFNKKIGFYEKKRATTVILDNF